jgi:hypothetical protein
LRRMRVPGVDEIERILLEGLPPREPGADEEPAPMADDDENLAPMGALIAPKQEGSHGGRRIEDIIAARAGARRGR